MEHVAALSTIALLLLCAAAVVTLDPPSVPPALRSQLVEDGQAAMVVVRVEDAGGIEGALRVSQVAEELRAMAVADAREACGGALVHHDGALIETVREGAAVEVVGFLPCRCGGSAVASAR